MPETPTPTPVPFAGLPSGQQSRLQGLSDALRKANIADATAKQIVQQQAQLVDFSGFVTSVVTSNGVTGVNLSRTLDPLGAFRDGGKIPRELVRFPPNDPKYLSELLRAMNNKFAVLMILAIPSPDSDPIITTMEVAIDMNWFA
jgi:hypothetical protein